MEVFKRYRESSNFDMKLFILYGENDNFSFKTISNFFKKQSEKIYSKLIQF